MSGILAPDPSSRPAQPPEAPVIPGAIPRVRWPLIVALAAIGAGLAITENISDYVLPLTIQRFTTDAAVIGLILAINPLFGFIANPLSGIIGDRIWTPLGRRALLLLVGAPIVAVCLMCVPQVALLWHLVVLVTLYQFFQDVLWGAHIPLLADLVPPAQRTMVSGILVMCTQAMGWLFARYGMGRWLDAYGDEFVYRVAALVQVALVTLAAMLLREQPPPRIRRPRLTVQRYVKDFFADPDLRRFAWLGFWQRFSEHILLGFYVLFAVQNLQLGQATLGKVWSWLFAISLFFSLPFSYISEHWLPKQQALVCGHIFFLGACFAGWLATDTNGLLVSAVFFALGQIMCQVTLKAFFTEFLPADLAGQLSGTFNICLALGRMCALAGGGWLISRFDNDYRLIFPLGIVASAICILFAVRFRDIRFQQRLAAKMLPRP